jgi:sigma-E factor negative regulatory protein RseC
MSHICLETGVVTGRNAETVRVRIRRAEACHTCDVKGVCQAFGGKTEDVDLMVSNTLNADVGDEVALSLLESSVIKASAALYLLPAVGLAGGALAGASVLDMWNQDGAALLGALIGLAGGVALAKWFSSRMSRDVRYVPRLTQIVSRAKKTPTQ